MPLIVRRAGRLERSNVVWVTPGFAGVSQNAASMTTPPGGQAPGRALLRRALDVIGESASGRSTELRPISSSVSVSTRLRSQQHPCGSRTGTPETNPRGTRAARDPDHRDRAAHTRLVAQKDARKPGDNTRQCGSGDCRRCRSRGSSPPSAPELFLASTLFLTAELLYAQSTSSWPQAEARALCSFHSTRPRTHPTPDGAAHTRWPREIPGPRRPLLVAGLGALRLRLPQVVRLP